VGVVVSFLALTLIGTACSVGRSANGGQSGSDSGSGAELAVLSPPSNATVVHRMPGPQMKGPVIGDRVTLPLFGNFPVPDGPIGDPQRTYTFCFSQAGIHPWSTEQKESVMLEAARHPNVHIIYSNPGYDALGQVRDIENCLNRKVDGVLLWPDDVAGITPITKTLCAAHMLTIGMETAVNTRCANSWIYFDVAQETRLIAQAICQRTGGHGVVAEVLGTLGTSPTILRSAGIAAGLHQTCPNVQLIKTPATNFDEQTGYQVGLTFLQSPASKDVSVIFSDASEAGLGVLKAEQQLGRTNIPIYGIDADRQYINLVDQGKLAGVVDHTPQHGDLALRLAIYAVEGKPIPKAIVVEPPPLITKANSAASFAGSWGNP
jgi:ribose transport system substrate-binding protein